MARNRLVEIVTSLLCFCALFPALVSGQSASLDSVQRASLDQATLDLFVGYSQSNDLKSIIYSHARREPMEGSSVALYSTWFLYGSPHAVMATIVYLDGRVYTYLLPETDRTRRWKELPAIDLPLFTATVKTLPESTPSISLTDLVIVSFRVDGKWQTRLYNRRNAPAELTKIYQLAHSDLGAN